MSQTSVFTSQTVDTLLTELPKIAPLHAPSTPLYELLETLVKPELVHRFREESASGHPFGPFGTIKFPYFKMGAIDSVDLFGLDELIIYSFYWVNRNRYKNVLDVGGNIGLHSLVMDRCGFNVTTFEPDATHFAKLLETLELNECSRVTPVQKAMSSKNGTAEFVRVLGNTTSSHIAGSKNAYGDLETYEVPIQDIKDVLDGIDFMKMDVEGHEKDIILAISKDHWLHMDAMVEIGTKENAQAVFSYLKELGVNAFAQKLGWAPIQTVDDIPVTHREGSLFISTKNEVPWYQK